MKLLDLYRHSFRTVVQNSSVTFFLVIYLIIASYLTSSMFQSQTRIVAYILSFCVFLFGLCFISGWAQVLKDIATDKNEDNKENETKNKNYFSIFLEGIGKNIISIGVAGFIYVLLFTIVLFLTGKIAHHIFGSLDFVLKDLITITQDSKALNEYFNNLTVDQKYIIYSWQLCFILATMVFNFVMMFYFPAVIYEENKNKFLTPFIAFKNAVCFLFKNFLGSSFIYFSIYAFYILLSVSRTLFVSNFIIGVILLFIYIYFISTAIMLLFIYYGQKYNCNNRCDCIRENENINKSSEEN